jgi:hypothetical protein
VINRSLADFIPTCCFAGDTAGDFDGEVLGVSAFALAVPQREVGET